MIKMECIKKYKALYFPLNLNQLVNKLKLFVSTILLIVVFSYIIILFIIFCPFPVNSSSSSEK